jgi:hypothetical protein
MRRTSAPPHKKRNRRIVFDPQQTTVATPFVGGERCGVIGLAYIARRSSALYQLPLKLTHEEWISFGR